MQTIASKLKMNTFIHEVEKVVEPIDDCGEGRWGLYCAYLKNVEVDVKQLAVLTRQAIDAALARKKEQFKH
jgi:6-phosphogluconate dehydrogenase (decarboxylating)